nr:hypothetical protein [Tanacetum cinerariifolium]
MPDIANISDLEDTDSVHLPKIKPRPEWLKPILEEDRPETLEPDWIGNKKLNKSDLEGPSFKVAKAFHGNNISLQFQMGECHRMLMDQVDLVNPEGHRLVPDVSKPLPLGRPPGHRLVPDVSKPLPLGRPQGQCCVRYLLLVVQAKEFYITRHDAPSDRNKVRSHIRILNAISLKTYERYGYTFLKEIVLRIADYKEYKISEANIKNLHPNDFKDMYLLHLQEDYTIVNKPRAVIYRDKNDQKKMMRETKAWKQEFGLRTIEGGVHIKLELVSSCSGRDKFITASSYLTNMFKEIMKAQADVTKLSQL